MPKTKKDDKVLSEDTYISPYQKSKKEQEVVSFLINRFRDVSEIRNRPYKHFDGLTLTEYIEDSVRRFTTNIDEREGLDDWQARVHDPMTRNKVVAVLAQVVQQLPVAQATPRGDEDFRRAQILSNLYEYSEDLDDFEVFMVRVILEAIVKGTAIIYEGHERKETKVRDIVSGDADTIKVKERTKRTNRLYSKLVRLEDFYPSNIGVFSIKEMPYCYWRDEIPYSQFKQDYSMYAKSEKVMPMVNPSIFNEGNRPDYLDYVTPTTGENNVEILRYYNKDTDEFVIIANGVWLNPLIIDNEEVVSPIPFNHKELPFVEIKNELLDSVFFYGKSLPDKLKTLQDVLNVLTNMLLDQSFLTVFKPILTNGYDSIEDDFIRPGRRTPIDTQGLSIKESVMELDLSTPTGWHQYILEYTRKIMEEASVDKTTQGIAGVGERTTAQEIRAAAAGVTALLGILGMFVKNGIKRKATLRVKNIMQFYSDPDNPIVETVGGEGASEEFAKAFNTFKFKNTVMTNGKRGIKVIEMYKDKDSAPNKEALKAKSDVFKLETGKNMEIVAIDAEYIRNADVDIEMVPNPNSENTRDMEKAMQLEKDKVYLSFFPDIIDKVELAAQTMEVMGDDPTLLINENILNPQQQDEGAMAAQQASPESTQPSSNLSDNIMRGGMGGEQMLNDMQLT